MDLVGDDLLFNSKTNSTMRPPTNEQLFRFHRNRLLSEASYLLFLALAVALMGAYARSRYGRDGRTVHAVSLAETCARLRGIPMAAIEFVKPLLTAVRSVALTIATWAGLILALLDTAISYKIVQYALIVPGLILPMFTLPMLEQPLCRDVTFALHVPIFTALGKHSHDEAMVAGVERIVELSRTGKFMEFSNGRLLADDDIRRLVVLLSRMRMHDSCADTSRATEMLGRMATACVKLPQTAVTIHWVFHALVPRNDDNLRCPSDSRSFSLHEHLDRGVSTIESSAASCAALVEMLHDWQHMCALSQRMDVLADMDYSDYSYSYAAVLGDFVYQPEVDASYVYRYSGESNPTPNDVTFVEPATQIACSPVTAVIPVLRKLACPPERVKVHISHGPPQVRT